jgi:Protein of unknown function (DUF2802)
MMLATISWPPIVLGVAAGLTLLVVYDVIYVWPIHRRISALAERCAGLERALSASVAELAERAAGGDRRSHEDLGSLSERLAQLELAVEERSYEQAIGLAERGEEPARLISCFGLTEGEANLVTLLHGDRARESGYSENA